jgi:adenosine deaminase
LGLELAQWAVVNQDKGVVGLGLGGPEVDNPPELFRAAFDVARAGGLASLPHAGETVGPESIWGALEDLGATRILHGVRCLEDPSLVEILRQRQVPLDVCPTSNVCLGVAPSLAEHPLPQLVAAGLLVTINSDDPPMFNTTLTDEYLALAQVMDFDVEAIETLVLNGVRSSLLPAGERDTLEQSFRDEFDRLRSVV